MNSSLHNSEEKYLSPVPPYVLDVLARLEEAGYGAYLVGGCVRDILMGRVPSDWDAASSATCAETAALFARTVPTGEKYGTVTVLTGGGKVEVTTFRTDGGYADGRRPESVSFTGKLEEDLSRRDFTVNAMAMDRRGRVTDLFGGMSDIKSRLIRCVGEPERRFGEDALRMLRAYRFSAVLGFDICAETGSALRRCAPLAAKLSAERVRDEAEKIIASPGAAAIWDVLDAGLLDSYSARPEKREPFTRLAEIEGGRAPRWGGFALLLERQGCLEDAGGFFARLRLDGKTASAAAAAAELVRSGALEKPFGEKTAVLEQGRSAAETACRISDGLDGTEHFSRLAEALNRGECCEIKDLAVTGQDVTAAGRRGPAVGEALKQLAEAVIREPGLNTRPALLELLRDLPENRDTL